MAASPNVPRATSGTEASSAKLPALSAISSFAERRVVSAVGLKRSAEKAPTVETSKKLIFVKLGLQSKCVQKTVILEENFIELSFCKKLANAWPTCLGESRSFA